MLKRFSIFTMFQVIALVGMLAFGQTAKFKAIVVDDSTGEPLPYASVYVSPEKGTMTNDEGEFSLVLTEGEEIRISYVGYETMHTTAEQAKRTFRLKRLSTLMQEVTVLPTEKIMTEVAKRLYKDYRGKKRKESNYFYRLTNTFSGTTEMTEAFLRGRSAVNLRDISFYSGRRVRQTRYSRTESNIGYSNLQHLVDLGPMTVDVPFWKSAVMPLYMKDKVSWQAYHIIDAGSGFRTHPYAYCKFAYNTDIKEVVTGNGNRIYCIDLKMKNGLTYPAVEGTLYVDAKSYRVLSFEGKMRNMALDVGVDFHSKSNSASPVVKIIYTHDRGFSEVESVVATMEVDKLKTRSVLYNMRDYRLPFDDLHQMKTDLVSAIDEAGYDSTLWSNEVVRRTVEEQQLAWFANLTPEEQEEWILAHVDTAFSQSGKFRPLVSRLDKFGKVIPQEKVYLHMDNTSYMLGDTIWFKAYTRQTNTDKPSDISGVLYAELWNHDGYMLQRKQIEIKNGSGHGFFALDKDGMYAGFYELRAYTRWQLNWGVFEHKHSRVSGEWFPNKEFEERFYRDYDKLYSRTFPVYDAPATPESFDHTMTLRVPRRTFKKDPDKRKLVLSLFPEGGNLVKGVPCRVAFEASWNDGQWVEGWLQVDEDSIPVFHRGRGYFVFTPTDKRPKVQFTTFDGEKASAKLPKIEDDGVALQVIRQGESWNILTSVAGKLKPNELAMTVMNQGRIERIHHAVGQPLVIPVDSLEAGVHQVTVFDAEGRVYADRLFFSYKKDDMQAGIQIEGIEQQYVPYAPVRLTLKSSTDKADISLAVRDANRTDLSFDNGSIMTEMLLASEIKGFVPDPGWYFQKDDDEHRKALDLLMMTQGWRRFDWRSMAVRGVWDLTQPDEKAPILIGKVYPYDTFRHYSRLERKGNYELQDGLPQPISTKIPREVKVHTELLPFIGTGHQDTVMLDNIYVQEKTTREGKFRIQLPRIYDRSVLYLDASDTTKWTRRKKYTWVQLCDDWEDWPDVVRRRRFYVQPPEFYVIVDFPYPRFVKPYTFHQKHLMQVGGNDPDARMLLSDGTTMMSQVTVDSKRNIMRKFSDEFPIFQIDAYEAFNMAHDAGIRFERTQVSDYGLDFPYVQEVRHVDPGMHDFGTITEHRIWDDRIGSRYSWSATRRAINGLSNDPDSVEQRKQLRSHHESYLSGMSDWTRRRYNLYSYADKYIFYSDYAPRLEGSRRYWGADLPETDMTRTNLPNEGRRAIYRNRRFVLPGFAACGEFYNPDYSQRKPDAQPTDYRRTLYWNPNVKLDEKGQATVKFYNNARTTQISVDVAGQSQDGTLLWNDTTEQ